MGAVWVRNNPIRRFYLNGKLVSEYYNIGNPSNYGDVEITDSVVVIDGKQYTGRVMVLCEEETQIYRLDTE